MTHPRAKPIPRLTLHGKPHSVAYWARRFGVVSPGVARVRIHRGMHPLLAVLVPPGDARGVAYDVRPPRPSLSAGP